MQIVVGIGRTIFSSVWRTLVLLSQHLHWETTLCVASTQALCPLEQQYHFIVNTTYHRSDMSLFSFPSLVTWTFVSLRSLRQVCEYRVR